MLPLQLLFWLLKKFKVPTSLSSLKIEGYFICKTNVYLLFVDKVKGDFVSKEERTATDKKRARRKKKIKQRLKQKQIKSKENELQKLNPNGKSNFAKEKVKKDLERLLKDKSVSHVSVSIFLIKLR